jgi:hypothetical protein
MALVKIEITLSSGEQSIIEKEIADELLSTFDEIEEFTTKIKREMLPDIQADLLKKSQYAFKKKEGLVSKGYRQVSINGIEGKVRFSLERYKIGSDFFSSTKQFENGLESKKIKSWIKQEVQHKSYSTLCQSLETLTGDVLYSSNHLCNKIKSYAKEVTVATIKPYHGMQLVIPFADADIDIYDAKSEEILLFDDAIGVKRQKEKRVIGYKKELKTVQTDLIEVQKPSGRFEYITGGYGVKDWNIETALSCWICYNYQDKKLPIVAITDGAKSIRLRLWRVFGGQVVVILDWYHLNKKMRELLSMVAWGKKDKEEILKIVMPLLWKGKTDQCIAHVQTLKPRNQEKFNELIEYLTKHKHEIIDYKKRKEAGKTIGSGRAEKGVDLVVAQRQKNKPIAWSEAGSHALSVLRADDLNMKMAA